MPTSGFFSNREAVILERVDRARNAFRYYSLSVERTLFDEVSLVREWGRIGGGRGQRIVELYADREEAEAAAAVWIERKRRRGYG